MAESALPSVTTSGTGGSDHLSLGSGYDWMVEVTWAGSAGDADLQGRYGQDTFIDIEDSAGVVNITANKSIIVPGGGDIRLDVTTHTSAATMTATRATKW